MLCVLLVCLLRVSVGCVLVVRCLLVVPVAGMYCRAAVNAACGPGGVCWHHALVVSSICHVEPLLVLHVV